jgi:hypothetical protein
MPRGRAKRPSPSQPDVPRVTLPVLAALRIIRDHPGVAREAEGRMRKAIINAGMMEPALLEVDRHRIYLTALGAEVLEAQW